VGPETLADFKRKQLDAVDGKVGGIVQGDIQGGMATSEQIVSVGPPSSESGKEDRWKDKRKYTGEIN